VAINVPDGYIEFRHVWKKFRRGELHDSLRDLMPAVASRLFRPRPGDTLTSREFWAVEDVSFTVRPGEALGIIGANGAGKSTVLRLLTRILRPTRGACGVRGRVGALIEIAAGFHQDLTGAENIFLQGSIMGMTRREIAARFDDIVAFSELSDFIDTPVKRYSSGMNARLGFAIAAHLSPDVLIVDEVLAVGDYRFQRKAFDRINEMVHRGMPVVMVSHQLEKIEALCTECLLLNRGRLVKRGAPAECIAEYLKTAVASAKDNTEALPIKISPIDVVPNTPIRSGDWITVRLGGDVLVPLAANERWGVRVRALSDAKTVFVEDLTSSDPRLRRPGTFDATVKLQMNTAPGYFAVETPVWNTQERKELGQGPRALVHVESAGFLGHTNLHARVEVNMPPALAS
jgi:ABC-type polysaccharide/polyol phosphate transport system ATPase subunit